MTIKSFASKLRAHCTSMGDSTDDVEITLVNEDCVSVCRASRQCLTADLQRAPSMSFSGWHHCLALHSVSYNATPAKSDNTSGHFSSNAVCLFANVV